MPTRLAALASRRAGLPEGGRGAIARAEGWRPVSLGDGANA